MNPIPAWLADQPADVQAELNNLLSYNPEQEFVQALAELLPSVPGAGLVDLYYDIFYFCRPVFRVAVEQLHRPDDLSDFLRLAERAIVNAADVEAFKAQCSTPDDVDEVIFWLKRYLAARA